MNATSLQPFEVVRNHLYQQIADRIEQRIIDQRLRPGDRLPAERDLARMLGVNRSTVREGTRILGDRGLIELRPGRGRYVAALTHDLLVQPFQRLYSSRSSPYHELEQLRLILEPEIAALAAIDARTEDLARLSDLVTRLDGDIISPEERATADAEFHLALSEATHLKMLVALYAPLLSIVRSKILDLNVAYVRRGVQVPHPAHRPILEAVRLGEPDGARLVMRQHIVVAMATVREYFGPQ